MVLIDNTINIKHWTKIVLTCSSVFSIELYIVLNNNYCTLVYSIYYTVQCELKISWRSICFVFLHTTVCVLLCSCKVTTLLISCYCYTRVTLYVLNFIIHLHVYWPRALLSYSLHNVIHVHAHAHACYIHVWSVKIIIIIKTRISWS